MQVGVLPGAPIFHQGVMSAADGLPRKEEDASAILAALTILGRQADLSWLHLSRKQDWRQAKVGALPTPSAIFAVRYVPHASAFCSSKAEPSPDKRETAERYRAEGPSTSS